LKDQNTLNLNIFAVIRDACIALAIIIALPSC